MHILVPARLRDALGRHVPVANSRGSHDRFLLKYASRDEVQVLARGSSGVVEMRSHIEQYEDASPLFGFLRYRRRNVLVKYMPEGCSRLIQGEWLPAKYLFCCQPLGDNWGLLPLMLARFPSPD